MLIKTEWQVQVLKVQLNIRERIADAAKRPKLVRLIDGDVDSMEAGINNNNETQTTNGVKDKTNSGA